MVNDIKYYYQVGEKYKVRGVIRTLALFKECKNQGKDEVCRMCSGYCIFDNGEKACGWIENGKFDWVPSCPKKGDKDLTGATWENGELVW